MVVEVLSGGPVVAHEDDEGIIVLADPFEKQHNSPEKYHHMEVNEPCRCKEGPFSEFGRDLLRKRLSGEGKLEIARPESDKYEQDHVERHPHKEEASRAAGIVRRIGLRLGGRSWHPSYPSWSRGSDLKKRRRGKYARQNGMGSPISCGHISFVRGSVLALAEGGPRPRGVSALVEASPLADFILPR